MTVVAHDRRAVARQLLLDHVCSDDAERGAVARTLALLDASIDPFARSSIPGHVTGSAIVLDDTRERVLVVRHATFGRWLQPGGHAEPDDASPLATALRELAEEADLVPSREPGQGRLVHVDVHEIPPRGSEPAHFHHDFRFAFTVDPEMEPVERADIAWVRIAELDAMGADVSLRTAVTNAIGRA